MPYNLLADLVVLLHLLFILFAVLGGLLLFKWRWLFFLQFPAAFWAFLIEVCGWYCPLTPLENHFRQKAGESAYSYGFVEHYIVPVIYPEVLNPTVALVLAAIVVCCNGIIYYLWFRGCFRSKGW
ncbi:DUF2784 domain-containing protein [Xanthovirga aplysinae]|uniref:DUF2784 domain-containing protein n=1 Tax=Xanthovirga aplysinae TaxID=2529853 RepID=UPI0012BCB097|nr:DUF2784 domain-containing protein [Xanthovirga aplysinae]MTI31596.1 DUF2784 domain-containing protein [Xanthovirga aplysinae]